MKKQHDLSTALVLPAPTAYALQFETSPQPLPIPSNFERQHHFSLPPVSFSQLSSWGLSLTGIQNLDRMFPSSVKTLLTDNQWDKPPPN